MTTTEPENIIEVENLVAHYGERVILNDINLGIRTGEIRVIMGGSGSGKTTLMRNLLGLNTPSSGSIRILGKDITRISKRELYAIRRKMGVAFQGGALLGSMSVAENIELPLRQHTKLDESTIRIMSRMKLEVVNLAGFENLMPSELSGGMLKRAALARSIVMDPEMLFFDEPSAGLDPVVSAELDELILRLKDAMNVTIVVVTHELESAFKIADRITVLGQGNVLMTGTVDEVQHSDNEVIQDMLNRRPRDEIVNAEEYLARLTADREQQRI
ncbi:MAG: ABC transporter ATP-binding protein [Gammaproteobacteria bacterium]|nr:ABC transporter ATP-binding protein [Gammaproteobacteria bacterium]